MNYENHPKLGNKNQKDKYCMHLLITECKPLSK